MSIEEANDRTLSKNGIKSFILRIDLAETDFPATKIVEKMAPKFDRVERRQLTGLKISFTQGSSGLNETSSSDFVLISKSLSVTFSEMNNAFWMETGAYLNNKVYKDLLKNTIDVLASEAPAAKSKRIGMRYINEFLCPSKKNIGSIYGKRLSAIIKNMASEEDLCRVIGVEEYNCDDHKLRFQYGIPNKYYPAKMASFDLMLDIDAYFEGVCDAQDWLEIVEKLNHAAYAKFKNAMSERYLEGLR